jgi:cyclopropane fatty-acyl-phospholipid synthase-like methyltransferase
MSLKEIKGLKFPDEYFIKFFFKKALHKFQNKNFFDLGCSNGCNISLAYEYDNNVIGVDYNKELISFANDNFKLIRNNNSFNFVYEDMRHFIKDYKEKIDVLIMANSIYYISKEDFIDLLKNIKKNLNKNIPFFIRFRTVNDYRYGKGETVAPDAIIISNGITGEDGSYCKFYTEEEMLEILKKELNLNNYETMKITYENIQNNTLVKNEDIVIWGNIN